MDAFTRAHTAEALEEHFSPTVNVSFVCINSSVVIKAITKLFYSPLGIIWPHCDPTSILIPTPQSRLPQSLHCVTCEAI